MRDFIRPLFELGEIVSTAAAHEKLTRRQIITALERHVCGDWGDICAEDQNANETALVEQLRIMSVYRTKERVTFWIITEADRTVTTVLLPEDY